MKVKKFICCSLTLASTTNETEADVTATNSPTDTKEAMVEALGLISCLNNTKPKVTLCHRRVTCIIKDVFATR